MAFLKSDDTEVSYSNQPSVTLSTNAPRWNFRKKFLYTFARIVVPRNFEKLFNIEVNGVEHVQKFREGTPVIFCGNHKSHLDSIIFGSAVVNPKRKLRNFVSFMINGKAMKENFLFRQMKYLGGFPVFRDNPEPGLRFAIESLKANLAVIIFPQGGRVSHASVLSDYHNLANEGKTGVGRIILRLNGKVPVVPFYIHGSENVLKPGTVMPKLGTKMSITFGEPLYFSDFNKSNGWDQTSEEFFDTARVIANNIMGSIWNLLKNVEASFLETLETELGIPLENIDENMYSKKINYIIRKMKDLYKM